MKIVFSHMLMLLVFIDIWHVCAAAVCHDHLPKHLKPPDKSNWKLCVRLNHKNIIQLKIYRFFKSSPPTVWLSIGFPVAGDKISDLFVVTKEIKKPKSVKVQQHLKQHMSCKKSPKVSQNPIIVNCKILNHTIKYLDSKNVSIFYLTGNTGLAKLDKNLQKNLISSGTKLSFNLYKTKIKEDAGSTGITVNIQRSRTESTFCIFKIWTLRDKTACTVGNDPPCDVAVKLLQNYGKNMAAIIGIAFVLTTFITVTICCCCKKEKGVATIKEKDVSVSFYRDNGEVASESDSEDQSEKVAFIRNNNGRNSNV